MVLYRTSRRRRHDLTITGRFNASIYLVLYRTSRRRRHDLTITEKFNAKYLRGIIQNE